MSGIPLHVRVLGDPVLRIAAPPERAFDAELKGFVGAMRGLLLGADVGIGLAAPQVGFSRRVVVYDEGHVPPPRELPKAAWGIFINLEVLETYGEQIEGEACLSFPGEYFGIPRAARVLARTQTVDGSTYEFEADDLLARLVQHELDHTNGRLIVDHLPGSDRPQAIRRFMDRLNARGIGGTSITMDQVDELFLEYTLARRSGRRRRQRSD